MRSRTFWKGYLVLLLAVFLANYTIEAVYRPLAFQHHWLLNGAAVAVVALNLAGLTAFIRRRPLLGAGFWRLVLFFDLGLYGWAGGRIVSTLVLHPVGLGLAPQIPFTIAGALLLPIPLFVALYRYSQRPGVWQRN